MPRPGAAMCSKLRGQKLTMSGLTFAVKCCNMHQVFGHKCVVANGMYSTSYAIPSLVSVSGVKLANATMVVV